MTRSNAKNKTDGGAEIIRTEWTDEEHYTTYFRNNDGSYSKFIQDGTKGYYKKVSAVEATGTKG